MYDLLEEDEHRKGGNPRYVHHAAHEEQAHDGPATSDTVGAVGQAHPEGAPATLPPTREHEPERRLTVCQAGVLPRRDLVEAGDDEHGAARHSTGERGAG